MNTSYNRINLIGLLLLVFQCSWATASAVDSLNEENSLFMQRMLDGDMNSLTVATGIPTLAPLVSFPPSIAPSQAPSSPELQAIVEIEFDATFTLQGLSIFDVPVNEELDDFQASIADPLQAVLTPLTKSVSVQVTTVGGLRIGRRLRSLQQTVEIGFQVVASKDCFRSDCQDFAVADSNLAEYKAALTEAIDSDALARAIQNEASTRGVTSLQQSTVVAQSLDVDDTFTSVQVEDPDDEDDNADSNDIMDDEEDEETSASVGVHLHSIAVAVTLLLSFVVV
jgi:hypothetical protein